MGRPGAPRALLALVLAACALAGQTAELPPQQVAVNAESCDTVKEYFAMRNLTSSVPESPVDGAGLQVCRAERSCCTPAMEAQLQRQVHRDFSDLMHHNSKSTQGLLASTANTLQDHLVRLARWSETKTLRLFSQVYKRMAVLAREPIHILYSDIVRYLDSEPSAPGPSLETSVTRFFAKLFPLTIHTTVAPVKRVISGGMAQRQLDAAYERCLSSKMAEVQPFGDSPSALAHSLGRALEAARVLLGVLRVGAEVLNSTNSLLVDNEAAGENAMPCSRLLLRLWSCPQCAGLRPGRGSRPCQGYCHNVLRGCVSSRAADLDQPWASFVEAAAKLAGSAAATPAYPGRPRPAAHAAVYQLNAEEAIRQMDNKISEAIMSAMENGPAVERKMKSACGPPKWADPVQVTESATGHPETATSPQPAAAAPAAAPASSPVGVPPLLDGSVGAAGSPVSAVHFATTLRELQDSLLRSRSFYADLADVLCADEGFAARDSEPCWNGQRVGEYTKTVVAASAISQRYNPELPWTGRATEPRIALLSNKLRHLQQLVQSQLAPESDSFVLRDQEGEGSGSGHDGPASRGEPTWTESDDEDRYNVPWTDQGSGSGDYGPVEPQNGEIGSNSNTWTSKQPNTKRVEDVHPEKTSGADNIHLRQTSIITWVLSLSLLRLAVQ